jgi:hypothetical protein
VVAVAVAVAVAAAAAVVIPPHNYAQQPQLTFDTMTLFTL